MIKNAFFFEHSLFTICDALSLSTLFILADECRFFSLPTKCLASSGYNHFFKTRFFLAVNIFSGLANSEKIQNLRKSIALTRIRDGGCKNTVRGLPETVFQRKNGSKFRNIFRDASSAYLTVFLRFQRHFSLSKPSTDLFCRVHKFKKRNN